MSENTQFPELTPEELVSSFQILDQVGEAMKLICDGADPTSVTPIITRIHQRFEKCERLLDRLPGGSMTRAEQLEEIKRLKDGYDRKKQLVAQYSQHDLIARALADSAIPEGSPDTKAADEALHQDPDPTNEDMPTEHDVMKIDDEFANDSEDNDLDVDLPKDSTDDVLMRFDLE